MPATYDLNTKVGQARFRIPDTDINKAIFKDEEIEFLLEQNSDNPLLAAAEALEMIAGDPHRLVSFSQGAKSGTRNMAEDIRRRANSLRAQASKERSGNTGDIIVGTIERSDFW